MIETCDLAVCIVDAIFRRSADEKSMLCIRAFDLHERTQVD